MEGVEYWQVMDIESMLSKDEKPADPTWISDRLERDDRIMCKCLVDKYYYTAKIKSIQQVGQRRKFRVTFEGMKSSFDATYDYAQACDSFLMVNLQTVKFAKAYNAKLMQSVKRALQEDVVPGEEICDPNGRAFLLKFSDLDRDLIVTRNFRTRYPPRCSIAEFLGAFAKDRTAFDRVKSYSVDDFLADFQSKSSENNFANELFFGDAEIQNAVEYCAGIKNHLAVETIDFSYSFGVVHLLRYLCHLFRILDKDAKADEKKKQQFFLIHEISQFVKASKSLYYGMDDYIRV